MSTLQKQAAAIYKWGKKYPHLWPDYMKWCAELYRKDRLARGLED